MRMHGRLCSLPTVVVEGNRVTHFPGQPFTSPPYSFSSVSQSVLHGASGFFAPRKYRTGLRFFLPPFCVTCPCVTRSIWSVYSFPFKSNARSQSLSIIDRQCAIAHSFAGCFDSHCM